MERVQAPSWRLLKPLPPGEKRLNGAERGERERPSGLAPVGPRTNERGHERENIEEVHELAHVSVRVSQPDSPKRNPPIKYTCTSTPITASVETRTSPRDPSVVYSCVTSLWPEAERSQRHVPLGSVSGVNRLAEATIAVPRAARREPGGLVRVGGRRVRHAREPRTSRSSSRSATARATGAT